MESVKICQICFRNYDAKDNAPRCLPCGHIMCPNCLTKLLDNNNLRNCPFDKIAFPPSHNSLASFPVSFAIRDVLEQRNANACKAHPDERVKFFCLTDETKICFECAQLDHQGHKIKKFKTLKAKGAKVKEELQVALGNLKNYEQEKVQDVEQVKKVFIRSIDEQVQEIKNILAEKQFEWVQQVNNIFEADEENDKQEISVFKQQINDTIKDIIHACQDENRDLLIFGKEEDHDCQITAKRNAQFLKEKSSRVKNKVIEAQNSLKLALVNSQIAINSLQLSAHDVMEEIYSVQEDKEKLSQEELTRRHKKVRSLKFMSLCEIKIDSGCLNISWEDPKSKEVQINLVDFQEIEKINMKLVRGKMLKNEPSPNILSYIFHGLKKLVDLTMSFDHQNFNSDCLRWLGNRVQNHVHHLKRINCNLENCKLGDTSIPIFCDTILSKTCNLDMLTLNLYSCQIIDADLKLLVKAISPVHKKLEVFALTLANNKITNDGVYQLFETVRNMEALKTLELSFSGAAMTIKNLKMFGENVLPSLKYLDHLVLSLDSMALSDETFCAILKNLPDLKILKLKLENDDLTDLSFEMFIGEVLPRLKSLECLCFKASGKISTNNLWKIEEISTSLMKKKKEC